MKKINTILCCLSLFMATALLSGCEDSDNNTPDPIESVFEFADIVANHTSLKANIFPKDKSSEYIILLTQKKYYEANPSNDCQNLAELAQSYNMELKEFLSATGILALGNKSYEYRNLYPDTDYVLYCYGVAFEGESYKATTEICQVEIKTTAPQMKEIEFGITAQANGNVVTFNIDPKGYEGYYYTCIVPETDDHYLPEGAEFGASYVEYYRNKTFDEFNELINESSAAVSDFCHKGAATFDKRLEPNKKYMAIAFAVSEDQVPLLCSVPKPYYFSVGDGIKSDLVVDIKVTDITAYSAWLTLTPSNNDEEYAAVFLSKEQVSAYENEYDYMLSIIQNYQPAIFKGVHSEQLGPLMPLSQYVVLAFGIDNDLPTTGLFRYDFTSAESTAGKIAIESIDLVKLFDAEEIISLDSSYEEIIPEGECIAVVEIKTSIPTDKVRFWWYESWMLEEYNDEAFLEDLLLYDYSNNPELMPMYYSLADNDTFFAGIAEDDEGNLSDLYYGELFTLSAEDCDPAEEFFDYMQTQPANTFVFAVDRKRLGSR